MDNGGEPSDSDCDGSDIESSGWNTVDEVLGDGEPGEVVVGTTDAQVHRARSPMAEEAVSTAAPTHVTTSSIEDTVINLEETSAAANTEPGDDEGGANNAQRRNINAEQRSGNGQEQEEVIPG